MFCTVAGSRRHRLLVDNLLALAAFYRRTSCRRV